MIRRIFPPPSQVLMPANMAPHSVGISSNVPRTNASKLDLLKDYHLSLLSHQAGSDQGDSINAAPILTADALRVESNESVKPLVPHGLLGGMLDLPKASRAINADPRVFFNIGSPSSTFICGSQGSGKSHTLSCLLENCLIKSDVTSISQPMTAVVFHYDSFISDFGGSPCEAAFLSSNKSVQVRVLCSPTNERTVKQTYQNLSVKVEPLQIDQDDLNTKRMLDLMAINSDDGSTPLYVHTMTRILREMRIEQQAAGTRFSYGLFKKRLDGAGLTPPQRCPLDQRLETLESFMPSSRALPAERGSKSSKPRSIPKGTSWTPEPGVLTIVDLSCPCITPEMACCLFNICLSIFLEKGPGNGRVVALDEAHKYMNASAEASIFTNTLLSAVRLQRHLGVRVVVSTQEPTISPSLLDLSSTTIVHRFTSPEWLRSLKAHLAPVASRAATSPEDDDTAEQYRTSGKTTLGSHDAASRIFEDIVRLQTGEALLFAPSGAVVSHDSSVGDHIGRLGFSHLKVKIRQRLTADGGKSILSL